MKYLHSNEIPWHDYDVIGFDMDGTLYDEQCFIRQVYKEISNEISLSASSSNEEIFDWMFSRWDEKGSSYPFIFSETIDRFCIIDKDIQIEKCLRLYRNFNPRLELSSSVSNLLKIISKEQPIFLITDGHYHLQERKFNSLNLYKWFSNNNVFFTGSIGGKYYKPHTKSLSYVSCLNHNVNRILYVGDRDIDERFANNAGFDFVKVHRFNEFWEVK